MLSLSVLVPVSHNSAFPVGFMTFFFPTPLLLTPFLISNPIVNLCDCIRVIKIGKDICSVCLLLLSGQTRQTHNHNITLPICLKLSLVAKNIIFWYSFFPFFPLWTPIFLSSSLSSFLLRTGCKLTNSYLSLLSAGILDVYCALTCSVCIKNKQTKNFFSSLRLANLSWRFFFLFFF